MELFRGGRNLGRRDAEGTEGATTKATGLDGRRGEVGDAMIVFCDCGEEGFQGTSAEVFAHVDTVHKDERPVSRKGWMPASVSDKRIALEIRRGMTASQAADRWGLGSYRYYRIKELVAAQKGS